MTSLSPARTKVFICYSHKDNEHLQNLLTYLRPLERQGRIDVWSDKKISAGSRWDEEIKRAISAAKVAVLLLSSDFFASDFIADNELPLLLKAEQEKSIVILSVLVRPCNYLSHPDLSQIQFVCLQDPPLKALTTLNPDQQEALWSHVAQEIEKKIESELSPQKKEENILSQQKSAKKEQKLKSVEYLTGEHLNPYYQSRDDEFTVLENLLLHGSQPARVGLVGMAGIGKTQLARQFVHRYEHEFLDRIFWIKANTNILSEWYGLFAELARRKSYLPLADLLQKEEDIARHFCRNVLNHEKALLVLDNVKRPDLIREYLQDIIGREVCCAILYTSHNKVEPDGFSAYELQETLEDQPAQKLLLSNISRFSSILSNMDAYIDEQKAMQHIISACHRLPLALIGVNARLRKERTISLQQMAAMLENRGLLIFDNESSAALRVQWEGIESEEAKILFALAISFPDESFIPLWLIALASGIDDKEDDMRFVNACIELKELSLVTYDPELNSFSYDRNQHYIRFHSLLYAFGQKLLRTLKQEKHSLFVNAAKRLVNSFGDLPLLEQEARKSYTHCLQRIQSAVSYIRALDDSMEADLMFIQSLLEREREALEKNDLWLQDKLGLFYQHLFNGALQKGQPLEKPESSYPWLRLLKPVIPEEPKPLKHFVIQPHHDDVSKHRLEITSVAFSPDNSKVLLSFYEKEYLSKDPALFAEVWILDAITGEKLVLLEKEHEQEITQAIFSPDGMYILTGSVDMTIRLWDAETGKQLHCFEGHNNTVNCIAFSPDGSQIATGSADGTVTLWDTQSRQQMHIFYAHQDEVTSVAFSPDGLSLVSCSLDKTARLWSVTTKKMKVIFDGHQAGILHVSFSPDGSKISTASEDKTTRLWNARTGEMIHIFGDISSDFTVSAVIKAVFALDNSYLVTASYNIISILPLTGNNQPLILPNISGSITNIALASNGRHLLVAYSTGNILLWDLKHKDEVSDLIRAEQTCHKTEIAAMALSGDGRFLIAADESEVWRWDVFNETSYSKQPLQTLRCFSVASNDKNYVLLGATDGLIIAYTNNELPIRLECNKASNEISQEQFSFDPNDISILDTTFDEDPIDDPFDPNDFNEVEYDDQEQPDFIDDSDDMYNYEDTDAMPTSELSYDIISVVSFTPDDNKVLIGFMDGRLALWKLEEGEEQALIVYQHYGQAISNLAFSPNKEYFISSSHDEGVYLWQLTNESPLKDFLLKDSLDFQNSVVLTGIVFTPDSENIITSENIFNPLLFNERGKPQTRIWNIATDTWRDFPEGLKSAIHVFSFSPNGQLLLTCDNEGEVRLWCVESAFDYRLTGIYNTTYPVKVARWLDEKRFLLVDTGGYHHRPRFHYLEVEGLLEKG